jgi:alkanesulfonate monooxygenase SsuD/methylene tetrahydromethanopterin reductase-like flavin-dependent oxidoreductase (luciferase family)
MEAPSTGVVFRPEEPPERLREVVSAVEAAGVAELWLWEDCFLEGGLTSAAAALAWSERLRVGVGLLPVPLRNPALAAMEIATLARLFPGRFVPTVGRGVSEWMDQVGGGVSSPTTLLAEYASAVRDLLHGHTVQAIGRYVQLKNVALGWPPPEAPPLLIGGRGPRTIRCAGELADGVLLDSVVDVAGVRSARAAIDEARQSVGRPGRPKVVVFVEVDPHSPAQVREAVEMFGEAGADTVVLQGTREHPDPEPIIAALA